MSLEGGGEVLSAVCTKWLKGSAPQPQLITALQLQWRRPARLVPPGVEVLVHCHRLAVHKRCLAAQRGGVCGRGWGRKLRMLASDGMHVTCHMPHGGACAQCHVPSPPPAAGARLRMPAGPQASLRLCLHGDRGTTGCCRHTSTCGRLIHSCAACSIPAPMQGWNP